MKAINQDDNIANTLFYMSFLNQLRTIKRLHHLIARKSTGCPKNLASRLEISRATLFRYIDVLINLGADVQYCSFRESYYYQERFELNLESLVF
ncbi:MAG: hypothetical protein MI974_03450 [Chitinophagales bacterium]|nr:hypothetical protein [Chitinophagales bacterium]